MTAHKVRTILPIRSPAKFKRELAIEARIADWAGLHTLLDWVVLNCQVQGMAALAQQWAEQLQAIMEGEELE